MSSPADLAYRAIATLYPEHVFNSTSPSYPTAQKSFWSQLQQAAQPTCFFQPRDAGEVGKALVEVIRHKAPFAIKAGGHSSNAQGSSVNGGVQFDLVNLRHIEIDKERGTVRLGAGLRWGELYEKLQKEGLIAVGGRDCTVGVAGFIFGGGLSHRGTMHGWGLDSLAAVDIVLADGRLVTVDADNHADLFTALHGGGAQNFGVVTSLTLNTYSYNGMWGGVLHHAPALIPEILAAYDTYTHSLVADGKAHAILAWYGSAGTIQCSEWLVYPEPVADPAIFDAFRKVPSEGGSLRFAHETELTEEVHRLTDAEGMRTSYSTYVMEYDLGLLKEVLELWRKGIEDQPARFQFGVEVNHITPAHRNKGARGGQKNVFGLDGSDDILLNVLLVGVWQAKEDDDLVQGTLQAMGESIRKLAKEKGKYVGWKYGNYAARWQDVVGSYGEENRRFLKEVAAKYDPEGVFQSLQVGGFKLEGGWANIQTA